MIGRSSATLVVNPVDDTAFRAAAADALAVGDGTTDGLATALRSLYPNVVVRARGLHGEAVVVWYVYREGRWIRS